MSAALAVNEKSEQRALTQLQKKLADLWLEATFSGLDIPQHELAKAAGYGGNSPEAMRVIASKALSAPHVRAYLRQQARERMDEAGIVALAALKRLTAGAKSERVQGDIAYKVAVGTGMLMGEGQQGGAGIAIQFVFRHESGNGAAQQPQVVDVQAVSQGERSLAEEARTPLRPTRSGRAKGGGVKTARESQAPGSTHNSPPKKSRVKKSRARKSRDG